MKPFRRVLSEIVPALLGVVAVFFLLTVFFAAQQTTAGRVADGERWYCLVKGVFFKMITFQFPDSIWFIVKENTWRTLLLIASAIGISLTIGIAFGALNFIAERRRSMRTVADFIEKCLASFPGFLLAIVVFWALRTLFGGDWPQEEVGRGIALKGFADLFTVRHALSSYLLHLIAPAFVLAVADGNLVYFIRTIRMRTSKVGEKTFLSYLRDTGYPLPVLLFKHVLPHILIDIVYLLKYRFVYLLSSAAVVEMFFMRPGISRSLITMAFHDRGSFEAVLCSVWVLSLMVMMLVVCAELIKSNASPIVVRAYYPVARTVYDLCRPVRIRAWRTVLPVGLVIIVAGAAFSAAASNLMDGSVSPQEAVINWDWPGIFGSVFTTITFTAAAAVLALLIAVGFGMATALSGGPVRRLLENVFIGAFDIVPKFFLVFICMGILTNFPSFEGTFNSLRIAVAYCVVFGLFCWTETARSIIHRMDEIHRSPAYALAVAGGCSFRRILAKYYVPVVKKEVYLGALTISLLVIFMESALSYCGAGISKYTVDFNTVASLFVKASRRCIFPPSWDCFAQWYVTPLIAGAILVVLIFCLHSIISAKTGGGAYECP
jgi:ABC-type dipeptide/oligopeptide/nickel transport system permease component